MNNILDQIIEVKKEEVSKLKKKFPINSFKEMEFFEKEEISFSKNLPSDRLAIISEIKKASPSKGIIRKDFDHLKIAEGYFECGTDAISILTDKNFFKGDIKFLKDIAYIKQKPLLRKDFIINEHQVFESKANGADLILLISEALSKAQINELTSAAIEIGMEVLLELHSEDQLKKIDFNLNKIIGINNRNLEDFSVDLNTTAKLSKLIPNEIILISESGIHKKNDIDFLIKSKVNSVLIGEYLMAFNNIKERFKELKEWCIIKEKNDKS